MYEESYNKVRLGGWMDGDGKSGPRQAENGGWMDDERMDGWMAVLLWGCTAVGDGAKEFWL